MVAWLLANGRAGASDASVAGYAAILFGVSNLSGAVILFCERVSHRSRCLSSLELLNPKRVSFSSPTVS